MLPKVATIGVFDGVHKGHRYMMNELRFNASQNWCDPLIVTFSEHPREVLETGYVPQLLTLREERRQLLDPYGEVLMLPFREVQPLTARDFLRYLHDEHNVRLLLMGYDHRFGSDQLTDLADYRRAAAEVGINIERMNAYLETNILVSSTQIRRCLSAGDVDGATLMLGRAYAIDGTVVHGKGIGRQLGFPTANLSVNARKMLPADGVYGVRATLSDGISRPAILNIGTNPTLGRNERTLEVHIPAFAQDLYGQDIHLELQRRLRDEKRFENVEALRVQIKADIDSILRPGTECV